MKSYDNYNTTQAFTGDFETLEPGGYVCKILKATVEEKDYGQLMRIAFDIAEGEHKDFYRRKFNKAKEGNSEAKWQGMYYQTIKESDLKYFKGFMTAIENSNSGYKWDWDEVKLTGKLFGGVFGQEEYENSNGEVKLSTKCRFTRSVEQIKKGVDAPEIKKLASGSSSTTKSMFALADIDNDDGIPF